MKREFHPVANIFPLMQGQEFSDLCEDIEIHGLRDPICLHSDGRIVDGRNRYLACEQRGIEPEFYDYDGTEGELLDYVLSLNLHRRHLSESQRAMVAAEIANLEKHSNQHSAKVDRSIDLSTHFNDHAAGEWDGFVANTAQPVTQEQAADMLSVSVPSLKRAKQVKDKGTPELVEAVKSGRASVSAAAEVAELPQEEQAQIVAKGEKEILAAAKVIRAEKAKKRKEEKLVQLQEPGAFPDGKFRIIYADPPWSYGDSRETLSGTTGAAHHYPTMKTSDICKLPIKDLACENSVLFMWATAPLLEDALEVLKAWGFQYKAQFVWDKVKHNYGHYNSVRHELLFVCTRGSCTPDQHKLFDSVQEIERTEKHSEKPEEFRGIIDTLYPHGPRIELFRRGDAPEGWQTWGNEAVE